MVIAIANDTLMRMNGIFTLALDYYVVSRRLIWPVVGVKLCYSRVSQHFRCPWGLSKPEGDGRKHHKLSVATKCDLVLQKLQFDYIVKCFINHA